MGKLSILFLLKRVDCNDGVASYVDTTIGGLCEMGHRVIIASGPVTVAGAPRRHESLKTGSFAWLMLNPSRPEFPRLSVLRQLLRCVRDESIDVICPQGFGMLPLASILGWIVRRAVVANYHSPPIVDDVTTGALRRDSASVWIHRALLKLFAADRFVALSSETAEFCRRVYAISSHRIASVPCAVRTDEFFPPSEHERAAARATLGLGPKALVCVLPGRLNLLKRHDIAVEATRLLRAERPDLEVVCLFPGAGDESELIKSHALRDHDDIESFRFLGFIDDMRAIYWASDIVLLPSRREGFGIAVAEAMCAGCVPIRTPSGGARDQIIEGETGYIVPFEDHIALARRIADLADPERRHRMRAAASRHALLRFDRRIVAERTAAIYQEAAQERRRTASARSTLWRINQG